ncbi:Arylsulfatase [Caulifigura coniformis]|uniref:Arylsulfatase n=1 Tax=Caulifigura coniformis TaxID=2527983 RepID=A0A517SIE3_9PLAN|nr:sulfatase [Caulifigura coniformis]QDT55898.1 Arylsulfatase [Caulifigura coniformis]
MRSGRSLSGLSIILVSAIALLCDEVEAAESARPSRPNIILFLVDDMGWSDCGAYGSTYYETPNIDAFAKKAMRFTDAYAQPLCSPTRGCILTGKHAARHGITSATGHISPQGAGFEILPAAAPPNQRMRTPASKNYLDPEEYTLAEALRDAGYRTAHVGKWHLGLIRPHWPERQGFEVAFHCHPDPGPPGFYFSPYGVHPSGAPSQGRRVGTITDGPKGEYIVDRLADEAIRFIETDSEKPFFLNLWSYGVHGPWGHKEEYTKGFASKVDPSGRQQNPIMASMLRSVDECFGKVLTAVERRGLSGNTIIVFNSDNGGNVVSNTPADQGFQQRKATVPPLATWEQWAGKNPPTNNAPLREGKASLYEGGTRVPLMWSWPGKITSGTTNASVVGHIDLYPTLLALAGLDKPTSQAMDGISYANVLQGGGTLDRVAFFNYFPHFGGPGNAGGAWVRRGNRKLIRWFGAAPEERFELYDLSGDIGESKNLAASEPEEVRDLDAQLEQFLEDTGAVLPQPNPAYRPTPK